MPSFWIGFLEIPNDIMAAVGARVERQRVLFHRDNRFVVVLGEQALRTSFGAAQVKQEQLNRLLEIMSMPNVSLGIIPLMTERPAVASAGFWIFDSSLAALETPTASLEAVRPQEIELYARMFQHLQTAARHGHAARALVIQALDQLMPARQTATSLQPRSLTICCGTVPDGVSDCHGRPVAGAAARTHATSAATLDSPRWVRAWDGGLP